MWTKCNNWKNNFINKKKTIIRGKFNLILFKENPIWHTQTLKASEQKKVLLKTLQQDYNLQIRMENQEEKNITRESPGKDYTPSICKLWKHEIQNRKRTETLRPHLITITINQIKISCTFWQAKSCSKVTHKRAKQNFTAKERALHDPLNILIEWNVSSKTTLEKQVKVVLTLSQQPLTSLQGSCVQHCKLH